MNNTTHTINLTDDQIVALENIALCIVENRDALSTIRDNSTNGDMSVLEILELAVPVINAITEQFNA